MDPSSRANLQSSQKKTKELCYLRRDLRFYLLGDNYNLAVKKTKHAFSFFIHPAIFLDDLLSHPKEMENR
jgi:hypothetical protein